MNKTKIEWTDYTWNPVTGCPEPHCWYCYAKKMYRRFPALGNPEFIPKFFPERLKELGKLKKYFKIFVCSCADLFAKETQSIWRDAIFDEITKFPQHTYQLLTKRPQNIRGSFPKNVWVGTTINNEEEMWKADSIKKIRCGIRFLSFEPLLGEIKSLDLQNIDWVIVGKLTGSKKMPLDLCWVQKIIDECRRYGVPVFVKNNVGWKEKIQEFPKEPEK